MQLCFHAPSALPSNPAREDMRPPCPTLQFGVLYGTWNVVHGGRVSSPAAWVAIVARVEGALRARPRSAYAPLRRVRLFFLAFELQICFNVRK